MSGKKNFRAVHTPGNFDLLIHLKRMAYMRQALEGHPVARPPCNQKPQTRAPVPDIWYCKVAQPPTSIPKLRHPFDATGIGRPHCVTPTRGPRLRHPFLTTGIGRPHCGPARLSRPCVRGRFGCWLLPSIRLPEPGRRRPACCGRSGRGWCPARCPGPRGLLGHR